MLRMRVCTYIYTLTPCDLFPSSLLRIHFFGPRYMIPSTNFVQAASSFIAAEAGSKLGMHSLGDRQLSFTSNVNGRLMVGSYSPAIQHGESPFLGKSTKWWKGKPGCWWRVWDRLFCGKFAISILSPLKDQLWFSVLFLKFLSCEKMVWFLFEHSIAPGKNRTHA